MTMARTALRPKAAVHSFTSLEIWSWMMPRRRASFKKAGFISCSQEREDALLDVCTGRRVLHDIPTPLRRRSLSYDEPDL